MVQGQFQSVVPCVHMHHFHLALQSVSPSVSRKDQKQYDALRNKIRRSRGHLQAVEDPAAAGPAALSGRLPEAAEDAGQTMEDASAAQNEGPKSMEDD